MLIAIAFNQVCIVSLTINCLRGVKRHLYNRIIIMKYWKLDRVMQKSGVEYSIEEKNSLIQIETEPEKNDVAHENIKSAMKKDEILVNSQPGKFSVIQGDIRVYKNTKEGES